MAQRGPGSRSEAGLRGVIPLLAVVLALATALALLLVAATLAPPSATNASAGGASGDATLASAPPDATATMLVRAVDMALPAPPVVLELAALIYAPASGGSSRSLPGPLLIVVEAGALDADLAGAAQVQLANGMMAIAAGSVTLHVGDRLMMPASTPVAFRNDDATPTVILAAGVFPARIVPATMAPQRLVASGTPARWDDYWTPGATIQSLGAGWIMDPPTGRVTLDLRRLDLAPGAQAPLFASSGMAIGVEAGALALTLTRGLVWMQAPDGPDVLLDNSGAATLLPGDGALIQNQAAGTLRNDGSGPLLILVLTVSPAITSATPRGPT